MPVSGSTLVSSGALAVAAYSSDPASQLNGAGWTVLSGSVLAAYNPNLSAGDFINGILSVGGSEAFVAINNDTHQIAISYRGTQGAGDIITDIIAGTSSYYSAYLALNDLVVAMEAYAAAHPAITSGLVTGHSLGGALAELFMSEHTSSFYQAVTFGSPGDHTLPWAANTDERVLNIRHTGDPVVDSILLDGGVGLDLDVNLPGSSDVWTLPALAAYAVYPGNVYEHTKTTYQHSAYALGSSAFWSQYQSSFSNFAVQIGSDGSSASDLQPSFNDQLSGSNVADYLLGAEGNDTLSGFAGNDLIDGGIGNDSAQGRLSQRQPVGRRGR